MNHIPRIIINKDLSQETKLFLSFLNHQYHKHHRNNIFRSFPELAEVSEKSQSEEERLKSFVSDFYSKNQSQIDSIIQRTESLFKTKSQEALKILGKLMNYEWQEPTVYTAIPTILPFSPFENKTFHFSILAELKGKQTKERNALSVAIHEISHFIFFEQLKKLQTEGKIKNISKETIDYIKEALAVVLLNQESLRTVLNIENYSGNPELKNLFLDKNGTTLTISNFIRDIFDESQNDSTFQDFLIMICNDFYHQDSIFQQKRKIWNQIVSVSNEQKAELEEEYSIPIKITSLAD